LCFFPALDLVVGFLRFFGLGFVFGLDFFFGLTLTFFFVGFDFLGFFGFFFLAFDFTQRKNLKTKQLLLWQTLNRQLLAVLKARACF